MLGDDAIMIAFGAAKALDRADDAIHSWQVACQKRDRIIAEQAQRLAAQAAEIQKLSRIIKDNMADLDTKSMRIAGLEAERDAYARTHPDSPLHEDSGKRFRSTGAVKTRARIVYEGAHDHKGRRLGISDPAARREH